MGWLYYLLVLLVFIALIGISFFINKSKNFEIRKQYLHYITNNSTNIPLAFTHAKVGKNKYENYYFDSTTGNFEIEIEDCPVNLDGTTYDENLQHGTITHRTDGFEISGILGKFSCPVNGQWIWDEDSKVCRIKGLCNGEADINFIKGLTRYQFQSTMHNNNYHNNNNKNNKQQIIIKII